MRVSLCGIDKSTGDESRQRATRFILVGSGARVSAARLTDRLAIKVERRLAVKASASRIVSSPGHHQHEVGGSLPRAGARPEGQVPPIMLETPGSHKRPQAIPT